MHGQAKAYASILAQPKFLPTLHKILQCPLFSDLMDQVWFDLRRAAFDLQEDDSLSQIIMASTLNIIQNQGSKNKGLMESVLMKIHDATVGDPDVACPFTAPAFHLSFKVSFALGK